MSTLSEMIKGIKLDENKKPLNINEDIGKLEEGIRKRIEINERANNRRLAEVGNMIIR